MRQCILTLVSISPVWNGYVLNLITSCFSEFISPAAVRSALKREKGDKYGKRKDAEQERVGRKELRRLEEDELAVAKVFS